MAQYFVSTIQEYIDAIPIEQRDIIENLRKAITKKLDKKFVECINYGMIGYVVPHSIYPAGYHCDPKLPLPFAGLAAQKNSINLYHMGVYGDPKLLVWFQTEYAKACKYKLDMGKACIRFKKYDDIPYDLITELFSKISVEDCIAVFEISAKKK
jgi:uncharacterized protein YdhG (YjbR/CyaY superfamily)